MGAFLGKQKLQLNPEMQQGGSMDQDLLRQMATQDGGASAMVGMGGSPTRSASLGVRGPAYSPPMPEDRSGGLDELVDNLPDPDAMGPEDRELEDSAMSMALDKPKPGKSSGKLDFDKPGFAEEVGESLGPRDQITKSMDSMASRDLSGVEEDDDGAMPLNDPSTGEEMGLVHTGEDGKSYFTPTYGDNAGVGFELPNGLEGYELADWAGGQINGSVPQNRHGESTGASEAFAAGEDVKTSDPGVGPGQPHSPSDDIGRKARSRILLEIQGRGPRKPLY